MARRGDGEGAVKARQGTDARVRQGHIRDMGTGTARKRNWDAGRNLWWAEDGIYTISLTCSKSYEQKLGGGLETHLAPTRWSLDNITGDQ